MHGVLLNTPPDSTMHWSVIALGLVTVIYIAFIRPLRKGKKKDPLARGPNQALLASQRAMERDMSTLLVEYEQMMRKMSTQLETRVAKLEILIQDADERLAALKVANAEPLRVSAQVPNFVQEVPQLASPAVINETPRTTEEEPSPHAEVYELADEGLTFRQIAQRLDRGYGEIELILALRPRKEADTTAPTQSFRTTKPKEDAQRIQPEVEMALADALEGDRAASASHAGQNSHRRKKRRG